jgi:hypothetical protein
LLAAWLALSGCVALLELDEREDAVARLCKCVAELPPLGDCVTVLSSRLASATEDTRAAWLEHFAARCGSDPLCPNAYDCYAQRGTCSSRSCESDAECCDYLGGAIRCDPDTKQCVSCIPSGGECGQDAQCCPGPSGATCDDGSCTALVP